MVRAVQEVERQTEPDWGSGDVISHQVIPHGLGEHPLMVSLGSAPPLLLLFQPNPNPPCSSSTGTALLHPELLEEGEIIPVFLQRG